MAVVHSYLFTKFHLLVEISNNALNMGAEHALDKNYEELKSAILIDL